MIDHSHHYFLVRAMFRVQIKLNFSPIYHTGGINQNPPGLNSCYVPFLHVHAKRILTCKLLQKK